MKYCTAEWYEEFCLRSKVHIYLSKVVSDLVSSRTLLPLILMPFRMKKKRQMINEGICFFRFIFMLFYTFSIMGLDKYIYPSRFTFYARLSDALRRRLVVTGYSARIQHVTSESSAWFFNRARCIAPSHEISV